MTPVVDHDILGLYVARALDRAARLHGYPKSRPTGQRAEFTFVDGSSTGVPITASLAPLRQSSVIAYTAILRSRQYVDPIRLRSGDH